MDDTLDAALRSLSTASDQLNTNSNILNVAIGEVQAALQKFNLGVEARVEIASTGDKMYQKVYELGYGKGESGKWVLLLVTYISEDPDTTWNEQALLEAPRDWRIAAVDKIPVLIQKLVDQVNKSATEAATKAAKAKQIAASITRKGR